jgi:hypothetical protein
MRFINDCAGGFPYPLFQDARLPQDARVEAHPTARLIAAFDHYGHVKAQSGEIDPEIKDSKNLLFCMSGAIPNVLIASLRPRSIAVNELDDRFVVNFMEAPTRTMTEWVESTRNT